MTAKPTPTVGALADALAAIAPLHLAEEWDNVGLILGDRDAHLRGPVVLTIDLTERVMDECERVNAGAIVAYHPPIFSAIKRLTASDARQKLVLRAAAAGMAICCPHTALDGAEGGLADWLADTVMDPSAPKSADRRALYPRAEAREGEQVKIVTFVPAKDVDRVRDALASAGAGIIGKYTVCSFAATGTGTFLGAPDTKPAVGAPGEFETAAEMRLEMVCSRRALALAMATLKQFHPYEEPAVDVYPLEPRPVRTLGVGRRVMLDHPVDVRTLAARVKKALGVEHVMIGDATGKPVRCAGVCPGSGAGLMDAAVEDGCDVYVTGEMKHHDVLAAMSRGLSLILAGHTATERGYLPTLAKRLGAAVKGVEFRVASEDRDPLVAV
ncbi:MAG: Nif3-like dinuclear metal center hexameric protein [Phycisphaerales bacterium]